MAARRPYEYHVPCPLLDSLHVQPESQGQGLGKQMILDTARRAVEDGYPSIAICITRGNDRAEQIYTRLGARFDFDFTERYEGYDIVSTSLLWDDLSALLAR